MGDVDLEAKSSHGGTELMCRLCMKTNGGALNIFVSIATSGLPVWNVIQDLIRVQISEGDGLPDTVCCNCLRKLMEFSEFKEMCIKSASELEIRKINAINTTLKVEIKEEPNISDEESEQGQSYREENIVHNETEEMQVACDPLDVDQVDVKEEASLDASTHEMESYGGDDDSNDSSQEKTGYNVVCLPIDMGKQVPTANTSEALHDSKSRTFKRNELTLQEKIDLIDYVERNKCRAKDVQLKFNCGKTQMYSILRQKEFLRAQYAKAPNNLGFLRKTRKSENVHVNQLVLKWVLQAKEKHMPLSGPIVQEKAREIADKFGNTEFKASNGWLESFRARNNLSWKKIRTKKIKPT